MRLLTDCSFAGRQALWRQLRESRSAYGAKQRALGPRITPRPRAGEIYGSILDFRGLDGSAAAVNWENSVHGRRNRPLRDQRCHRHGP